MKYWAMGVAIIIFLSGCAHTGDGGDEDKGPGFTERIVLWTPNRVLDLGDIARFGVMVGPGIGFDAQATKAARAAFITDTSVGVGYETLRHLPFAARSQNKIGAGPVAADAGVNMLDWPRDFWDAGLEIQALIAGAHVFVNPWEMVDFAAGIVLLDPVGDDLSFSK